MSWRSSCLSLFIVVVAALVSDPLAAQAQGNRVQWIWSDDAGAGVRHFRREFNIPRAPSEGSLDIAADSEYSVWVNGTLVGSGKDWRRIQRFDITKNLVQGPNAIAVTAKGGAKASGLLVRLGFLPNGQSRQALVSDGQWRTSRMATEGWQKAGVRDRSWTPVRVIGAYGQVPQWANQVWEAGGDDRFTTPPGFRVEEVAAAPAGDAKFSLINMCFDSRGRLFLARERGPVLICANPGRAGAESVRPYCEQVPNCQGMCWVGDSLYLVGGTPQEAGLYRVQDKNNNDKIDADEVTVLHKFPLVNVPGYHKSGGMGEHGPHAIIHGPDDKLYLVIGNHCWANPSQLAANSPLRRWPNGQMGPDQNQPNTTEDVLLPRLNDGRGHAANILAPGGTIWRMEKDGSNMALVSAGYRNHYDAAFNPDGELFTFDSDMEWDEGLPWYRAVRVCHSTIGSDFLWRTGSANTPDYYLDSLPPLAETGRGSPVGVEFYDHHAFPKKYRGAFFVADWALGVIYAVHLDRSGATYKSRVERFCSGTPMNVTDLAVGPDGALYFTMGGRDTQGGIFRIVADHPEADSISLVDMMMRGTAQPLAPWSRKNKVVAGSSSAKALRMFLMAPTESVEVRRWAMRLARMHGFLSTIDLLTLLKDPDVQIRADAVALLGQHVEKKAAAQARIATIKEELRKLKAELPGDVSDAEVLAKLNENVDAAYRVTQMAILSALEDADPSVRRRACEAIVRAQITPPTHLIWRLLGDRDRFVVASARLVLERIETSKWAESIASELDDQTALHGIVTLCKVHQAKNYAPLIYARLRTCQTGEPGALLDWLRTIQLALIHAPATTPDLKVIVSKCNEMFPQPGSLGTKLNRELAMLLTHFQRIGMNPRPIQPRLIKAMTDSAGDQPQQMHYFMCMRLLADGWSNGEKDAVLAWFEGTKTWTGGFSLPAFLDKMLLDLGKALTVADRARVMGRAKEMPKVAGTLLKQSLPDQLPPAEALATAYEGVAGDPSPQAAELRAAVVEALGRLQGPAVQDALRRIGDRDPAQRDLVAQHLAKVPSVANFAYLIRGLESTNPVVVADCVDALKKCPARPKPDVSGPWRSAILAANRLQPNLKWRVVELLQLWSNGRKFGADDGDWKLELDSWTKWYAQAFPKEPGLISITEDKPVVSKYRFEDLARFLEKDPEGTKGDPSRGRAVFVKAQCAKCHKFGTDGEGIGPDLSTLSKRFKRQDTLEALVYPSKTISDQYRSMLIETKRGQRFTGLCSTQGDSVTVLLSDATKLVLRKDDIESQFSSLVSVMPEKLLDLLTLPEIADLFAFLEGDPMNLPPMPKAKEKVTDAKLPMPPKTGAPSKGPEVKPADNKNQKPGRIPPPTPIKN